MNVRDFPVPKRHRCARIGLRDQSLQKGESHEHSFYGGIDLAKNVFSVHGVDARGTVMVRRAVSRGKLAELIAQLPPCLIGMEACSGAHEWAGRFAGFGHTVK